MGFRVEKLRQFREWLDKLGETNPVALALVYARMKSIKDGNFGDYKYVGDRVFELRIHYGPGYRLYYTVIDRSVVFLLCAGDKSSQAKDIKSAKKLAKRVQNEKKA